MTSEHEKLLIAAIKRLENEGFRVIRLDHRIIPDAIAIKENHVVAVEASIGTTNVYLVKRKLKDSEYDEEIIITRPYDQHYHDAKVYYRVLKLFKEHKYSYREIREIVIKEFNLKSLSCSTVHDWIKGLKKPLTLLNRECK